MSTKIRVRIYEAEHVGHNIELRESNSGLFTGLAGAIERTGETSLHESWPCALEQVEDIMANLRRSQPGWRHTISQLWDQERGEYVAYDSAHEYWYQIVTERNEYYPLVRTHVIHLIEETA